MSWENWFGVYAQCRWKTQSIEQNKSKEKKNNTHTRTHARSLTQHTFFWFLLLLLSFLILIVSLITRQVKSSTSLLTDSKQNVGATHE